MPAKPYRMQFAETGLVLEITLRQGMCQVQGSRLDLETALLVMEDGGQVQGLHVLLSKAPA